MLELTCQQQNGDELRSKFRVDNLSLGIMFIKLRNEFKTLLV